MKKVLQRTGSIVENKKLTDALYLVTIAVDDIPNALLPGQFIHVQIPGMEGHILRRPFSVYYVDTETSTLTVLYQVVGFGSRHLTSLTKGAEVDVMGPVGTPWSAPAEAKRVLLVAGGVGSAPLYMHACELVSRGLEVTVVLGAQTKAAHVTQDRYSALVGDNLLLATDDGSCGFAGFCTGVVEQQIAKNSFDYVACCGPEPMMKAVSGMTLAAGIPTYISLEKRMACGIGACLSCVVMTKDGNKRACVDGPVFDAAEVIWE